MTDQLALALGDRHAGQAANLAAGQKPYRDDRARVEHAVDLLVRSGAAFTADDVHRLVAHDASGTQYDRNLVSSVLGRYAQDRRIRREGERTSASRSRHASRNGVWRTVTGDTPDAPSPRHGD